MKKSKNMEIVKDVIPILEMNGITVSEEKGKVILHLKDGSVVTMNRYGKYNYSGKLKDDFLSILLCMNGNVAIMHPSWTYFKMGSVISVYHEREEEKSSIQVTENSFTLKRWGNKRDITLSGSTEATDKEKQYFFLRAKDHDINAKVVVQANEDDTIITAKGFAIVDGEEFPTSPWVSDHKEHLEQWIYDLCYPYQGVSYFEDIMAFLEQEQPGIGEYLKGHCALFGRMLDKTYEDQSKDMFALCMDNLLAPLGLMKREEITAKYLRLRNQKLEEK